MAAISGTSLLAGVGVVRLQRLRARGSPCPGSCEQEERGYGRHVDWVYQELCTHPGAVGGTAGKVPDDLQAREQRARGAHTDLRWERGGGGGCTQHALGIRMLRCSVAPDRRSTDTGRRVVYHRVHTHTDASRTITSECTHTGSFATASCPSPIKWKDEKYRRLAFPSKPLLEKRRKRDPTEWENDGVGPTDFSTSFGMSWQAPDQQEDKCNARVTLSTSSSSALEKASLTSGWRENNTNREHPWIHPGVPESTETTYRLTNRIPAKRGGRSEIAPMSSSGYARSARKIIFGRNALLPEEQMSTTHLNYLAGRTNALSGLVVDLKPGEKVEDGFAQSGFCKNLPHPLEVFPRSSPQELPPQIQYATSTQVSYSHPSKFRSENPIGVDAGMARRHRR